MVSSSLLPMHNIRSVEWSRSRTRFATKISQTDPVTYMFSPALKPQKKTLFQDKISNNPATSHNIRPHRISRIPGLYIWLNTFAAAIPDLEHGIPERSASMMVKITSRIIEHSRFLHLLCNLFLEEIDTQTI